MSVHKLLFGKINFVLYRTWLRHRDLDRLTFIQYIVSNGWSPLGRFLMITTTMAPTSWNRNRPDRTMSAMLPISVGFSIPADTSLYTYMSTINSNPSEFCPEYFSLLRSHIALVKSLVLYQDSTNTERWVRLSMVPAWYHQPSRQGPFSSARSLHIVSQISSSSSRPPLYTIPMVYNSIPPVYILSNWTQSIPR